MKYIILSLIFCLSACSHNVTSDTARGTAALRADAVVIRINEVQAAVIQACGPGPECAPNTIPTNAAREIVKACIDLRTAARSVPDGWQATVKTLWATAKPKIIGLNNAVITAAASAADALIGGL